MLTIPSALFNAIARPNRSYLLHLGITTAAATGVGWALAGITLWLAIAMGHNFERESHAASKLATYSWFVVVIVAPFFETWIVAGLVKLLHWLRCNRIACALIVGALAGVAHGWSNGAIAVVGPGWAFFIFTLSFQAWEQTSFRHAFGAAFFPHAANNAAVLLI